MCGGSARGADCVSKTLEGVESGRPETAEAGLLVAQANLGFLYASGLGLAKDEKEAAKWFRKAADHDDPLGQVSLGAVTFLGIGVPKNLVEAYMWTSLATAQGNERARSHRRAMGGAMTVDQIEHAKARVADFRPKERPRAHRLSRREVLRAFGISGQPSEYERFFGF